MCGMVLEYGSSGNQEARSRKPSAGAHGHLSKDDEPIQIKAKLFAHCHRHDPSRSPHQERECCGIRNWTPQHEEIGIDLLLCGSTLQTVPKIME